MLSTTKAAAAVGAVLAIGVLAVPSTAKAQCYDGSRHYSGGRYYSGGGVYAGVSVSAGYYRPTTRCYTSRSVYVPRPVVYYNSTPVCRTRTYHAPSRHRSVVRYSRPVYSSRRYIRSYPSYRHSRHYGYSRHHGHHRGHHRHHRSAVRYGSRW